jgi:hypothetical protein
MEIGKNIDNNTITDATFANIFITLRIEKALCGLLFTSINLQI